MSSSRDHTNRPSQITTAMLPLWARRSLFGALNCVSVCGVTGLLCLILSHRLNDPIAGLMIGAFVVNLIWVSLVFWNAVFGFVLRRLFQQPAWHNWTELACVPSSRPLTKRTAVAMTVRNEDASAVFARLKAIKKSLDQTHSASTFDYFILSDSSEPKATRTERLFYDAWCAEDFGVAERVTYRLRESNWGYKPGNIRDFCKRWGGGYDFMVLLDADSVMSGETIVRMVRVMEHIPQLGILQSLIVGILHPSLFSRLYEFGHRHVARCAIVGSTWWQGDRCQFWGHNAVIRIAPFARYCELPEIPGKGPFGGHILCHDQIEASFMHRAGYEVRTLPEESGSYEGNPPTIIEYTKRNDRWCRGNFQNLIVAGAPGLALIDRFHLTVVAQRFIAHPAQLLFIVLAAVQSAVWPAGHPFATHLALILCAVWALMFFMPRFLGVIDALLREPARYGGPVRLLAGGAVELCAAFFLIPITIVASSMFMVGLLRIRGPTWPTQHRDAYRLSWRDSADALAPQTLLGVSLSVFLYVSNPAALIWFAPFLVGLVLSVPFSIITSLPGISAAVGVMGLCATPEEIEMPCEVADVAIALGTT